MGFLGHIDTILTPQKKKKEELSYTDSMQIVAELGTLLAGQEMLISLIMKHFERAIVSQINFGTLLRQHWETFERWGRVHLWVFLGT